MKSNTENLLSEEHQRRILSEAQDSVRETLATAALRRKGEAALSPPPHEQTEREAVEAWENEGDPN